MAVLCEGISVIVRRDAIDQDFDGDWPAFAALVPNSTLCTDGELARVGFMDPGSVEAFVSELELGGLVFYGQNENIAVADQLRGPTRPCEWLEFGRFPMGESPQDRVSMCWLFERHRKLAGVMYMKGTSMQLHAPAGWQYEGSLSQQFTFVATEDLNDRMVFVRSEGGLKVYRDRDTGKEMFVGKPEI